MPKISHFFKDTKSKRFIDDWEYNSIKKSKEDEMNRILEKINNSGIKSLSKTELEFLNQYNKKSL